MYRTIPDPAPVTANVYKSLKWTTDEVTRVYAPFLLTVWKGRSNRPTVYEFRTLERRSQYIEGLKTDVDKREAIKVERKAEEDRMRQAMLAQFQVGDILHYSWGWEQTNCEFYQVIERRGATVKIRRIAGTQDKETDAQAMSCHLLPVRDAFIGDKYLEKRIGPYGLKMNYGTATPTDPKKPHYSSWYA